MFCPTVKSMAIEESKQSGEIRSTRYSRVNVFDLRAHVHLGTTRSESMIG